MIIVAKKKKTYYSNCFHLEISFSDVTASMGKDSALLSGSLSSGFPV